MKDKKINMVAFLLARVSVFWMLCLIRWITYLYQDSSTTYEPFEKCLIVGSDRGESFIKNNSDPACVK